MESQIKAFYKDKTIFLTGGTGFVGRVTIEKLLRSTDVAKIYVLARPKRGKNIQERIESWKSSSLFEVVLQTKANALERVVAISGDCEEPDLGISLADREILKKEVHVVLHCAATVNFIEVLHKAVDINTRATRLMLQLAKEMKRLEAFVHVSTTFSNCVIHHVTEKYYPGILNCNVDKVLQIREICDNNLFDGMTKALFGKFPNSYTYTKALSEQLIQTESGKLPVCIYRPASIVATNREPVTGWIDNIYGPIATVYGASIGVLRVAPVDCNAPSYIVPVDYCVNLLLTCAWQTAKESTERQADKLPPKIYNHAPHAKNFITNGMLRSAIESQRSVCPMEQTVWYPFLHATNIYWLYRLASIFYHVLPGYVMDLSLRLRGEKPRMVKLYDKIHSTIATTEYFMTKTWTFETLNTELLWQSLSVQDKQLFEFDMRCLDWDNFLQRALLGMRLHLGKEEASEESYQRGIARIKRLFLYHRMLQFTLCCAAAYIVKSMVNFFL